MTMETDMKTLVIALTLLLTACVPTLTITDARAARASAVAWGDPSEKCWAYLETVALRPRTDIVGAMTLVQKARNVRRLVRSDELGQACGGVAMGVLMTLMRVR